MDLKIVGSEGERTLYIVLLDDVKEEKIIPGSLFRLTHPGNRKVSNAQDEMLVIGGEKSRDKISTESVVNLFFDECIFPLSKGNAANASEVALVEKYGENNSGKPDFDKFPVAQMSFWKGLAIRFCKGDIFAQISDSKLIGEGTGRGRSKAISQTSNQ